MTEWFFRDDSPCDDEEILPGYVQCPICNRTSWNINDVKAKYCGNCHVFWGDALAAGELDDLKWFVNHQQRLIR